MQSLIPKIESRLATLPVPIALELPDGRRVAKPGSRVTLAFKEWSTLTQLARRQIGVLGEAYVEGQVQTEGAMRDLIDEKGLQSRVQVKLLDYRQLDTSQPFDKISSVGMFEHVGRVNMPAYFRTIHALLQPGGMVLNHGITAGLGMVDTETLRPTMRAPSGPGPTRSKPGWRPRARCCVQARAMRPAPSASCAPIGSTWPARP